MANTFDKPLLLLDNSSMMTALNDGEYKCENLTFDAARAIIDMHDEKDILQCFTDAAIETVIYDYLKVSKRDFTKKRIRNIRPGQDAIVFKLYITPSETQPIIKTEEGAEAKKIQNIYVYCQYLTRLK